MTLSDICTNIFCNTPWSIFSQQVLTRRQNGTILHDRLKLSVFRHFLRNINIQANVPF